MGDALFVHGGVTDAQEARLALAGLIALQGPSLMDARTGVMHGPGSTALVTGTSSTAPMRVSIAPHNWVTTRGAANGPYLGALAAAQTVDIAAAPASGTRVDVVYVKQNDPTPGVPTPDTSPATAQPIYGVLQGTVGAGKPSLATIVGAEELATVSVSAGATRTTDGTVLITNTARQVVARGVDIPVRDQAERDALTTHPLLTVKRLDTGKVERRNVANTAWETVFDPTPLPGWVNLALASSFAVYTESGVYTPNIAYRDEGRQGRFRGYLQCTTSVAAGAAVTTSALPAALRPTVNTPIYFDVELGNPSRVRFELKTDGILYSYRAITAPAFFNMNGTTWPVG